ncbi:SH3 domain-containing protein [Butyrivibrio sp. AC2005]|uniref:SH3 domain-containing protein n=1 Tax=Butyrivibrio sp. AC2005 TaxID=1280672 RepID=UPI00047B9ED8|nr:SH3 domain-containing protein [Butyrivibrio sp. AC2005]
MNKRFIQITTCFLFPLFLLVETKYMVQANISQDDIIRGANYEINYENVMHYRDKYIGDYIVAPMILGADASNADHEEFNAYIIDYYSSKTDLKYDGSKTFILKDMRYDKSRTWIEDDIIVIYGKYSGTETYYTTNQYTDKKDPVEVPVIEVYYDEITDDPFNKYYYMDSSSADLSESYGDAEEYGDVDSVIYQRYMENIGNNSVSWDLTVTAPDGYVNLREGPGTNYNIIIPIENGQILETSDALYNQDAKWVKVYFACEEGLYEGWVAKSQVSK